MTKVMHRFLQTFLMLSMVMLASVAHADTCQLDTSTQVTLPNYDPSVTKQAQYAFTLRVRAVTKCQVRLQVDRLDSIGSLKLAGADARGLRLGLSQDVTATVPLQAAPYDLQSWDLAAGQVATYVVWMSLEAQQWVMADSYRAPMRLRLVNTSGATLDEREVVVTVKSDAVSKVAFAGSGGRVARLDFGEISRGARRSVLLDVWANSPYRMTLSSQNSGYLQNTRYKGALDTKIAYAIRVSGQPLALSSGTASLVIQNLGQTRHQFDVELGAVERLLAGEYADDLLITVTAQ